MDILADLNPEQAEAVQAAEGPVLVLAGPGSGKTRVLTHRVAYLVAVAGIQPWRVMAVTFTNKAAREMMERLVQLLDEESLRRLTVGTFHATCARILRREAQGTTYDASFAVFDTSDQLRAVRRALNDLNLDDKLYSPKAILANISRAKSELQSPERFATPTYWHEVARRVYERYQLILRANNGLDFDDLLMETVLLFQTRRDVLDKYRSRYQYVLVDEFQDTNTAQYVLLKLLALADEPEAPHNIFVVGDEDQSVYRFRGADFRNVMRFRSDFPEHRLIILERNYRSTATIIDAARSIISRNQERHEKNLWTENETGPRIELFEAYNEHEEAAYVMNKIRQLAIDEGLRYRHFAVVYRTNAQSRLVEDTLVRNRIPYQLVGGTRFYERREVKDVLAYLRLVHNPLDELSLERIINVPPRGIGPATLEALRGWSTRQGLPGCLALQALAEDPAAAGEFFDTRALNALLGFYRLLNDLMVDRESLGVPELLDQALSAIGYERYLRDGSPEGEERWDNVGELIVAATEYAEWPPREGLAAFLESVALVSDVDEMQSEVDRVTLLTCHAAKGLEFPVVFMVGMEEDVFPHSRSKDSAEDLEEERRLCYVGVTRAMRRLYLVHAFRRSVYRGEERRTRSRFLDDIPAELIVGQQVQPADAATVARRRADEWSEEVPLAAQRFKPGDHVRHPRFGVGVVVASRWDRADEEVTVAFTNGGLKKLLQSMARLESVN